MKTIGALIAAAGVGLFVYAYFIFEITLPGARVYNLGLLQDRQNMIILATVLFGVGLLLLLLGGSSASSDSRVSLSVQEAGQQSTDAVNLNASNRAAPFPQDLSSANYQVWLIEQYGINKNEVLGKYVCDDQLFDTVDAALKYAHALNLKRHKGVYA